MIQGEHLKALRERLGLTRNAMSDLLDVSPITYASWETRDDVRVWKETAVRVGRFYESAIKALDLAEEEGMNLAGMVPFHLLATHLGIPQEILLARYRASKVPAFDAGILGLWVTQEDMAALR